MRGLFNLCTCCGDRSGFSANAIDRRSFMAGSAAALGAFAAPAIVRGAQAQAKPHRIDVHHHISPPTWLEALRGRFERG